MTIWLILILIAEKTAFKRILDQTKKLIELLLLFFVQNALTLDTLLTEIEDGGKIVDKTSDIKNRQ